MALGTYSRVDGRNSSNYCSKVTLVGFVALCLVAVWMMTSSSVVPVQNVDEKKNDVTDGKQEVPESSDSNTRYEDNAGDLSEDAKKGDTSENVSQDDNSNSQDQSNIPEKPNDNADENQGEKKPEESSNEENKSVDASKSEADNGETKKEGENSVTEDGNLDSNTKKTDGDETNSESKDSKEGLDQQNLDSDVSENKLDDSSSERKDGDASDSQQTQDPSGLEQTSADEMVDEQNKDQLTKDVFPSGAQSEILNETTTQNGAFSTQATESKNEKAQQSESKDVTYTWKVCNATAGPDYIPCLDNLDAIRHLPSTKHYEHRERHCPEQPPTCLVPLPEGYKRPIEWPASREKIWYSNVPHTKLAEVKGHQNWVKVSGEFLTFPGGGTQFKNGALHYIDFLQESVPDIAWGKHSRVILDVGCGVASFGGFLFERDVLTMSLAPKDEHEAQVQFALERGIPAISAVMGTLRLPYPGAVFDAVHCARCRVPWHIEGGKLLLELNRVLRPGGFFLWSATPVYQKLDEDVEIWKAMTELTKKMCWELVSINKDTVNKIGAAMYRKPATNECYEQRSENEPPMCDEFDDKNAAWNVPLKACMHKVPTSASERGAQWPEQWPARLDKVPYWLSSSQVGVYGKPAPEDFTADYEHWKHVVSKSYLNGLGISWSNVRNVMDMRAVYGGFAAALREMKVWVMNVVTIDSPDTLPIIYERGLFGMYHDWCESFSTYPRSYDLLHADHLFSQIKKKCNMVALVAEVDRILRPEGKLIVRDNAEIITELENMFKSMHWQVRLTYSKDNQGLLCVQKSMWRPTEVETIQYAIA
ncbi:putative S-adenosyl-L-methionine-dependent methyltransferase [Dillenia turbinata]|uniref:S-adenosyl-L-methionine-dependent methyltransferase n=1 Tax=Dillenia turbinata TaxID=194707 RepID=A0AAN8V3S4_9MAGN